MRKYEFTGETKTVDLWSRVATLHRIRAVAEFGLVKVGDLGGWIEKEENLSHDGKAWISGDAKISGDAEISGDAKISGDAEIWGNAKISGDAKIWGNAKISGDAEIWGNAEISGDAKISGDAEISGDAKIWGNAKISGDAEIWGNAKISGDAEIFSVKHVLVVGPIGSRNAYTTFFRDKDNEICVKCGCFLGKIDKFLKKVSETHGDSQYAVVYRATVEVAKLQIDLNVQKPFEIGDKVRIITAEENTACNWNTAMEKYLGTVMTITRICSNGYCMEEDHGMWFWDNFRIAGKVEDE